MPNLDAQIRIAEIKSLGSKNLDSGISFDEELQDIYGSILKEKQKIGDMPKMSSNTTTMNKSDIQSKNIVLVDSIISDDINTFAGNIYYKIFGREPNEIEIEELKKKVQSGKTDKKRIVYDFWKSPEGQKRNVVIAGFDKVNVKDILAFDGEQFVECCFLQILRRRPRENDIHNYCLAMNRQGKSKEEIIKKIMESAEAKQQKVEVVGIEKAYKKRKFKEDMVAKPVIGNVIVALWNHVHLNRRLAELENKIDKNKRDSEAMIAGLKEENRALAETVRIKNKEIQSLNEKVNILYNPVSDTEYLERMNMLLSVRKTLWGDEERLHISKRASVSTCFFNTNSGTITIGDYTFAGSNVSILTGSHDKELKGLLRRDVNISEGNDIVIGNGVWLGSNCTILGPATIGDNAVIAAGAVVIPGTNVEANTVYGGVPAKQIGKEIVFADMDSENINKALEYKNGILYTKGWSEERGFEYEGEGIPGHCLLESCGEVLIKSGSYKVKYAYTESCAIKLKVIIDSDSKEYDLSLKEGSFDIVVPANNNNREYITFNMDSVRDDLVLTIERV